jgi:hypothetical protein
MDLCSHSGFAASRILARGWLSLALLLAIMVGGLGYSRPAQALPSYARQTGQECAACHNGFPELTPYGRLFKLNGYSFTGGTFFEPLAAMIIPSFTHTSKPQEGGAAPHFGPNDNLALDAVSLFYGGTIYDHLGAFIQGTYDGIGRSFSWDNMDIRYARAADIYGTELLYGVSLNNSPSVQDAWNTTPAWGYPYQASGLAPGPEAGTLIEGVPEGGLGQQSLGLTPYIFWNRLIYLEAGGYKTFGPGALKALGVNPEGTSAIDGVAPYWRAAIEPKWGNNSWEFGTFGMAASLLPGRMIGAGTDHITDVGLDTQYQWLGERDSFSVMARFIDENDDFRASQALGLTSNTHDRLFTWQVKGSYWWRQTVGFTAGYFSIRGSSDALLYGNTCDGCAGDSALNSPNSNGWIFELNYMPWNYGGPSFWPWLNTKLGLQFIHYTKFDGAATNFDGAGANASDNDTLYAYVWIAF